MKKILIVLLSMAALSTLANCNIELNVIGIDKLKYQTINNIDDIMDKFESQGYTFNENEPASIVNIGHVIVNAPIFFGNSNIGYRISSEEQNIDIRVDGITYYGVARNFMLKNMALRQLPQSDCI